MLIIFDLNGRIDAAHDVEGEEMNFKITTEADMRRAEWLVASGEL